MKRLFSSSNCRAEYNTENKKVYVYFRGAPNISSYEMILSEIVSSINMKEVSSFEIDFNGFTEEESISDKMNFSNPEPDKKKKTEKTSVIFDISDLN